MTKLAVPLADAYAVADELRLWLRPVVERIEVAGSLRRGKPEVGDIELVAVPRFEADTVDLWGQPVNMLERRLDWSIERGWLARPPDGKRGPRYSKLRHPESGLQVDLFSVIEPAQFGLIFLIRTGPAAYSQWLMTEALRRGLHVAAGALRRGFACRRATCTCPIMPTPEEADVYAALRLPYLAPERREVG